MTRSAVKPSEYWLRKFEGVTAYVRIRWNIKQVQVEDMNSEKHTEYEYNEKEIAIRVPDNLITKIPKLLSKRTDITEKTDLARAMDTNKYIKTIKKVKETVK